MRGGSPKSRTPFAVLKQAREALHLSQEELADAAGCTAATVSDIENGRNHEPSHKKAVAIWRALRRKGSNFGIDEVFPVPEPASVSRVVFSKRRRA